MNRRGFLRSLVAGAVAAAAASAVRVVAPVVVVVAAARDRLRVYWAGEAAQVMHQKVSHDEVILTAKPLPVMMTLESSVECADWSRVAF